MLRDAGRIDLRDTVQIGGMPGKPNSSTAHRPHQFIQRQEGGGFFAAGKVVVNEMSRLSISNSQASFCGGGFSTEKGLQVIHSSVVIENASSNGYGGGFCSKGGVEMLEMSNVSIETANAGQNGGGFFANGEVVVAGKSTLSVANCHAASKTGLGGGIVSNKNLQVTSSSTLQIRNVTAGYGGGLLVGGKVELLGKSNLVIDTAKAGKDGGGILAKGEVVVAGMSTLSIANSHAVSKTGLGGGFGTDMYLQVTSSSTLQIRNVTAGYGGGLWVGGKVELLGKSNLVIDTAKAGKDGGGILAKGEVVVAGMSTLSIANSHAVSKTGLGGGFGTDMNLQVTSSSTLQIRNVTAGYGGGGGFGTDMYLQVTNSSTVQIYNATAASGGGFSAQQGLTVTDRSTIALSGTRAEVTGSGFYAGLASLTDSEMIIKDATAGGDGGAFTLMFGLTLKNASLVVRNSTSMGSAGLVHGPLMVSSCSRVVLQHAKCGENSSVLAASCLQLDPQAAVLLEEVAGGHGLHLDNDACSSDCSNGTFQVDSVAALNASGRLSFGLLFMQTCGSETVRLAGIHLDSWSGPLLSTSPSRVVIDHVTIDYKPPFSNLEIVAAKDDLKVDSLALSCIGCGTHGVAVSGTRRALHAHNPEGLQCPSTVRVTNDSTSPCTCTDYQTTRELFRGAEVVSLQDVLETCTYCERHHYYQNGECWKCATYKAWSNGKSDVCHMLPQTRAMLMTILVGATVFVLLVFIVFQVLQAPLVVVDARSDMAKENPIASEKMLMISVQGPIVDLPKRISRLVHQLIYYRAAGTSLQWLDFDPEKANAVKVSGIARRKVEVQNLKAPFDCAACQGFLHPMQTGWLFAFLCALWSLAVLLPVTIYVAQTSGNGVEHTMVTVAFCVLPIGLTAALLHPLVAWLIRLRYQATPFSEALNEYRKHIRHEQYAGPDATHPRNQGLMVMTLYKLWKHFDSFILNRNMHFIVANIVTPLTRKKEVSFVALWGGRPVDYFVSHSWGTSFSHFVSSIRCHAMSKEGEVWMDASYWICSFANNQWNIQEELGSTIMESAFAKALRGGIKGVVMVLDHEVQPLTRVWCLFEFLLSSREHLELVFGTDLGVIGDDGCTSFDIALEAGKRIKTLRVANCQASSDKDKTIIFDYIISELGSLQHMDEQIRFLMGQMLKKNLANVGAATTDLLQELGQT
eukprot:symbB.v1.2.000020.t1/scaffold5.1/size591573/20